MNKDRLIAVIVACVVVVAVVIVIAVWSPEDAREPGPEQAQVSAYDFATQLFEELTGVRREEFWREHEGKQVRWTSEPLSIWVEDDSLVVYFANPSDWGRAGVMASFYEDQRSSLLEISEDDLVVYTGVLTSYEKSDEHATVYLSDCAIVSVVTPKLLWWNSELEGRHTTFTTTIDPGYVYLLVLERYYIYPDKLYMWGELFGVALNRASGEIVVKDDLGAGYYHSIRNLSGILYDYEGITYESVHCASHLGLAVECTKLKAVDGKTGSVLWMRTLHGSGIWDFHIAHGILYISTAEGVGAFELPIPADVQSHNG